jgi:hypothetical protein
VDNVISKIVWTTRFLHAQGLRPKATIVYRDNTSSEKMAGPVQAKTQYFTIKLFYITDLIQQDDMKIEYCPTNVMLADFMTKPLVGYKSMGFRDQVLGATLPSKVSSVLVK